MSSRLTIQEARRLFAPPVVRVQLDWERLESVQAPVTLQVLDSQDQIGNLRTTWYVDSQTAREISFSHASGRPLRIGDLPLSLVSLEPKRIVKMQQIADMSGSGASPEVVPCYRLPGNELMLLDGNHRVGAMTVHGLEGRVLAVVIEGPLDPAILPDLNFWQ